MSQPYSPRGVVRPASLMAGFLDPWAGVIRDSVIVMPTYRSASTLISSDGTRTPGTAALFTEPARKGGVPPWAGDFRPANGVANPGTKAVGKSFTLELPDGRSGTVVVESVKNGKGGPTLALMGEDAPPF